MIIRKKSGIHGKGIFAGRNFKKGETVIKWKTHKETARKGKNASFVNEKFVLVPMEARINHSCNPNTYLSKFRYTAKRNISQGEEITTDYKKESWPGFKMKCNCGSKNCKGIVKF